MNDKYYISLKNPPSVAPFAPFIYWCGEETGWYGLSYEEIYEWSDDPYGDFEKDIIPIPSWIPKFTKSEMEKIMDGALYKFKWRDKNNDVAMGDGWTANSYFDLGKDYWEWTNPIINITPFEEAK